MKDFWRIMEKDIMSENFSLREWIVYGVVAPMVLIAGCVIAEWISSWM